MKWFSGSLVLILSVLVLSQKITTLISIRFKRDPGLESNMNSVIQTAHCECCVWRLSRRLPAVGRRASLQREQMHFRVARQREYIMLPF